MKCKLCGTGEMIRINTLGESFCNSCTKCPNCDEVGAIIDLRFSVLPCKNCKNKLDKIGGHITPHYQSLHSKEEYWATPFWKHMGLKLKPHEIAQEKMMKKKGLSYLDLQRARNKDAKPNPEMKKIVDLALKGELVNAVKKANDYRRQRFAGKSSKTIF